MGCLVAKPIVNGIEKDLKGKADVIRLNILSRVGREAASRYGVPAVPTLVVLGRDGEVVYRRTGLPDRRDIATRVSAL